MMKISIYNQSDKFIQLLFYNGEKKPSNSALLLLQQAFVPVAAERSLSRLINKSLSYIQIPDLLDNKAS